MENILYEKVQLSREFHMHVDLSHITLIKSKIDTKLDKCSVKGKLCRNPTQKKADMYEFNIYLFENVDSD